MHLLCAYIVFLMDNAATWNKILSEIKPQISFQNFKAWFSQTQIESIEDGVITLKVPSAFHKGEILRRYEKIISETASKILNTVVVLNLKIDPSLSRKKHSEDPSEEDFFQISQTPLSSANLSLNQKYSLENFVVGFTNNLAYAAAQAVVENPGLAYNPLYIYGPSGVGKTHLMHAIGNALMLKKSDTKIIFVSSEKFMNDFVESIKSKGMETFRHRYRSCDILLVDDTQFISGKEGFQEEFFHSFNDLHSRNSQLVFTSDRPPNEIGKLEERLKSRFQGGLMVDMQLPDFDTRMAILETKLAEKGGSLPEEYLHLIAENVISNTRELEGKLTQLLQRQKLTAEPLTVDIVRKVIGHTPIVKHNNITSEKILETTAKHFNLSLTDIIGPRRQKELVFPRQIIMYLIYEECKTPYEKIGQILGSRDHTTIMHGADKIRAAIARDREIQKTVMEIKQKLIS